MTLDARRLRRFLLAGLGLGVAAACATDEYTFVPDPACDNGAQDEGETDVDCGGDECDPCQAGDKCSVPVDCASEVCADDRCAAPTCEDQIRNGTETGRDCGGGQCDGCGTGSPCDEPADCLSSVCTGDPGAKLCEIACPEGKDECDGDLDVECETNLLTDPLHCNDCDTVCDLANAEQSCVSGRCMIASCREPFYDCNNEHEDGCETNVQTSANHCGACGMPCSDQNGTPSCENSECAIECDDGFFDCDDSRANGCEQNIGSDVLNCGECDIECPYEEGETPFCVEGECGATVCPDGFGNCDGRGDTCEKDLTTDVMHCGRCGGECTVFRGTPSCDEDGCGIEDCEAGFENCNTSDPDGGYMDGCETNTDADAMNCGMCGRACTAENGTGTCVDGECRVMTCEDGWFNCDSGNSDGGFANGCETNIADDKTNCGVCGRDCDALLASANATGQCVDGICERDQCLPNFGDCDTNPDNCESDFRSDEGDCGNCQTSCAPTGTNGEGNECVSGTCTPHCDGTHANCDTMGPNGCEINTTNDNMNCGGCNMPCGTGRTCVGSQCVCSGGFTSCSGTCVNTTNNNTHCGMCNNGCTGGRTCVNSVCQCPSGQTFCGSTCVDTETSTMHCGECNRRCQTPAGTATNPCVSGACDPGCTGTFEDCDSEPWDGCETDLATSGTDCGMCGRACQFGSGTNVTPASQAGNPCSGSTCMPNCASGFASCDSEPWDGCETDITTVTNCGQCGGDCADAACGSTGSTSCCVLSGTTRNCQAQITIANDVDASVAGGTLTFTHALQPGTNRLILLAVAAELGGGGTAGSRPDVVTYGGTAMTAGTEQSGGSAHWSPDLFFYYLTESGIGTKTGSQTVVVNGAPSSPNPGSPSVIIANLVQLLGVRQTNPLGPYAGGILPETNPNPDVISHSLSVTTTGSRIYSLTAGMFCGGSSLDPSVTPAGPTANTLLNNTGVAGSSADMRVAGAYIGSGSPNTLVGGPTVTYAPTWTYGFCSGVTHEAVVVSPAAQ